MTMLGRGREFDLIRKFVENARATNDRVQLGVGDDCALIPPFAISSDMSVEHVHFRRDWLAPDEIGYRAAAAALSDLAAVAAEPVAALISFAFTVADAIAWSSAVVHGARDAIEQHGAVLAGGDVARTEGPAVIDVVVMGTTLKPRLRSAARAGDVVWVTGELGGAAAAVAAWRVGRTPTPEARRAFARPTPRIREAAWLSARDVVNAMIDLSDGIGGDAGHIAAASECRVVVDAALLPRVPTTTIAQALSGGEDYELCFTAPPGAVEDALDEFKETFEVPLTKVGFVEEGSGIVILNSDEPAGFDHFKSPVE